MKSLLMLPERMEYYPVVSSFTKRFNQRRRVQAVIDFVEDPADIHVYAHCPAILPTRKPPVLVYDCMDDWAGFHNALPDINARELELCRMADQIWVVSRFLQYKFTQHGFAEKIRYVPNGVDYEHFSCVPALRTKRKNATRTLGYIGCLAPWFDAQLVNDVAYRLSDWEIWLIGPDTMTQAQRRCLTARNIRFLGARSYSSLPTLIANIDVCIIPFVLSDLIKATSPIKLYEYLAAGCPVVSTSMPEVLAMSEPGVVACADNPKEFASAVCEMINYDRVDRRQELARLHTWDARFSFV